jgi:nucleotide-binding universal stress UspA family protein
MRTSRRADPTIVVAVDNTPAGTAALRWAATRAAQSGAALSVVGVHETSPVTERLQPEPVGRLTEARGRFFAQVCDRVGTLPEGATMRVSMREGELATELADSTTGATMIVVGEPRSPAHRDLPEQLARRCPCPVTVVDEQGDSRRM